MDQDAKSKEYIRPMPANWWLQRWSYTKFMIRDVTSVFIAGYCVFLMVLLCRAGQGSEAFAAFYASLRSPLSVVLHLIALVFAVIHSVTFFNLTPRVIVIFKGDEKVPESVIAGLHYGLWAVASVVLIFIALW
jgi:fumarate reductase subunit C